MRSVFISYAAGDAAWPQDRVIGLATSLRDQGVPLHLDVWHQLAQRRKLGLDNWLQWMEACLDQDPLVLCLGSPLYLERCRRDESEPAGKGVAFESVQVVRRLYSKKLHNDGWLWFAIRDGATPAECVPQRVAFQCDAYHYPGEEGRLLDGLAHYSLQGAVPAGAPSPPAVASAALALVPPPTAKTALQTLAAQTHWAADHLAKAPDFHALLRRDQWDQRPPACLANGDAHVLAHWLSAADASACDTTLWATRRALGKLPAKADRDTRLAAERAAVALYCLAACRRVALAAGALTSSDGLITVPSDEHVYCAVIATVLCGGRLELQPSPQRAGVPGPACSFDVQGSPTGDGAPYAFDRAVYAAVFPNAERTPHFALDHQPLSKVEVTQLRARLNTLRNVQEQAIALVVRVGCARDQADAFGRAHALPVFICDLALAKDVLGVDAHDLVANLAEFWRELSEFPSQPAPTPPTPPTPR